MRYLNLSHFAAVLVKFAALNAVAYKRKAATDNQNVFLEELVSDQGREGEGGGREGEWLTVIDFLGKGLVALRC